MRAAQRRAACFGRDARRAIRSTLVGVLARVTRAARTQDRGVALLDGLINFYKPTGITSAKALYAVRKVVGQRKSGHAGTLDPAAEGVLILCLGQATKLVESLMGLPKAYVAEARLDVTSESFDRDRPLVPVAIEHVPTRADVEAALTTFVGEIEQTPPIVSALKVGGQPAYKLARRGKTVELKPRRVRIDSMTLTAYEWPRVAFAMTCGRGTYVRAVVRDLGLRLGTGGCLTALTRTAIGPFRAAEAWTLERLRSAPVDEYLISLERARISLSSFGS